MGSEMCIRDRCWDTVSALETYSIFNTNSKDTARITNLISERSLHRQLPRLRTAYRKQKKPSILAAGTKRDLEAQSGCIIAPQRPLCPRLSYEVCARFRTARGFHKFYAGFARGIKLFERSEFLIDTSQKKSLRVCTCARVHACSTNIGFSVWYYVPHTYVPGISSLSAGYQDCLLYTSPSPRDGLLSRMPSSA